MLRVIIFLMIFFVMVKVDCIVLLLEVFDEFVVMLVLGKVLLLVVF